VQQEQLRAKARAAFVFSGHWEGKMTEEAVGIKIDTNQTLDSMLHQVLNLALVAAEARAGSLMLVANRRGILQIKARLGKPRSGRKSETVYPIDGNSIAAWVVRNKRSYVCNDVEKDEHFMPSRSGKNFLSLLSVPIVYEDRVIAVINADAEEKGYFIETRQRRMESVAEQVAPSIAERFSVLDVLAEVGVELTRLPREGGVEPVLKKIAEAAVRSLGADLVTLYQYDQERDEFLVEGTGPTIAGEIRDLSDMGRKIFPSLDVPWIVVKERKSGFYSDVYAHDFLARKVHRPGDTARPRFVEREGIKSMAALLLPYRATELRDDEVVGVMFANYRTPHAFNIDEISALATFADYAAVAILNARREEQRRSEQQRAELMEREVKEQRRAEEQMRMVEMISANFAHRMSNLAGTSRVATQVLREHINPADEIALRQLSRIERQADVLLELAERLTRPFKETGKTLELTPIDVIKLLEEELARIEPDPGRITITKELTPQLPQVQSVKFQLRQVLHDIINNAVEAMKDQESGQLMIRTRLNRNTQRVEVEISDNGPGIRDDIRDKLFAPGVTTKKDKLGIGLWWCRTFMQAAGGDVVLRNTPPDEGTTFVVEIPCASKDKIDLGNPPAKKDLDILIVDDKQEWRDQLMDIIEGERYSIETAAGYAEAWRTLETNHFRLAIVDIRLVDADERNEDGLRLLTSIDRAGLDTQVIIVTGHSTEERRQTARQSSRLLAFIDKSQIDVPRLRELIRQGVQRRASLLPRQAEQ
jgi:signal transduction histidine kinase